MSTSTVVIEDDREDFRKDSKPSAKPECVFGYQEQRECDGPYFRVINARNSSGMMNTTDTIVVGIISANFYEDHTIYMYRLGRDEPLDEVLLHYAANVDLRELWVLEFSVGSGDWWRVLQKGDTPNTAGMVGGRSAFASLIHFNEILIRLDIIECVAVMEWDGTDGLLDVVKDE